MNPSFFPSASQWVRDAVRAPGTTPEPLAPKAAGLPGPFFPAELGILDPRSRENRWKIDEFGNLGGFFLGCDDFGKSIWRMLWFWSDETSSQNGKTEWKMVNIPIRYPRYLQCVEVNYQLVTSYQLDFLHLKISENMALLQTFSGWSPRCSSRWFYVIL